ncbi:DUF2336 domain-containing protein [Pseudorhodoplanes sinuspersici]|uniref:Uncharacterized protein n=1 Tax=Pseudorhodoplanes sinuspersici TaxID=1235591 RepID=A0A1W6ZVH4_9HYPH|nr:DUF2336 domain-containing protein [Pseudorhodoplanes sinuspersici]ARQ01268.1 hypothetical protein CAK95_20840 [Pseudorhodoplanes sinuspersici]RKE72945.1 uncharacterized protein (DUF2336 family) [Pseudorhodoplanes sinuspersici]
MIVRQFLFWLRSAPAGERAEATAALARAYLYSDLSNDDLAAAEGAMTMLLDDPSPLVRAAMAEVLAASEYAPASVIYALAADQPEISIVILERSPLLLDAELVDAVAAYGTMAQSAVARRAKLPRSVAAAIAEVGTAEACLELVENPGADIAPFSMERLVERFGHLAAIREALLARSDLPASMRQALVATLSRTLAEFVIARDWLNADRAHRIAKEACEKATVALAASSSKDGVRPLIRHLRESGQLTAGLILRALLSGNMAMFEEALAELSGTTRTRVSALIQDRGGAGLRALYHKAGLPALAYPAFREAVATLNEDGFLGDPSGAARLKRRMIERVLTRCAGLDSDDIEPLMMLLRRFATEAAREEARMFCDDLVDGMMSGGDQWQDVGAPHDNADHHDAAGNAVQDNAGYDYADYGSAEYAGADHGNWNDLSPDAGLLAEVSANDSYANDSDAYYDDPLTGGVADYESFDELASHYSNYNDERFAA